MISSSCAVDSFCTQRCKEDVDDDDVDLGHVGEFGEEGGDGDNHVIWDIIVKSMKTMIGMVFYDCLFRERLTDAGDREEKPESRTDQQVKSTTTDFLKQLSLQAVLSTPYFALFTAYLFL